LKEGINDGFLTPFKVKQIATTLDDYVYTSDDEVVEGDVEVGEQFEEDDFNFSIEIKQREQYRVKVFMEAISQSEKTLVFCATQAHALLVRDLINQTKDSTDPDYCVRVTANDGKIGEEHLRTFQDNDKSIPTILTTSQKLSTGVDARNIRNIVLMRPIKAMIEFKQIIGRGTRLFDGKDYFTIYDFVKAYEHFNDPEWDGEPADPVDTPPPHPPPDDPPPPVDDPDYPDEPDDTKPKRILKITLADGKERTIQHMMATSFYSPDGKPMSAAEFIKRLFGELPELFKDEDELRKLWGKPDTRKALMNGLAERGYGEEKLAEIRKLIDAEKSDLFDVLAYIAFALAPMTRQERVDDRRSNILEDYDEKLQAFLDFVLAQYVKEGVTELESDRLSLLLKAKYYNISDGAMELGGIPIIRDAFIGFQQHLYEHK
jgi:type I restriction enzyme, R subunit